MLRAINFNPQNSSLKPISKSFVGRDLRSTFLTSIKFNKKPRYNKTIIFPENGKLNFELLHVFYIVIICGNITLASERLGISQPAISLCLKRLEKETGILLFEQLNSRKFLKLTSSGLILFNYIQRLFQIIQESLDLSNSIFVNSSNCNVRPIIYNNSKSYFNSILNKKVFYPTIKLVTFDNFSTSSKNLFKSKLDALKHFETNSKILLYKNKSNYCKTVNLPLILSTSKINFEIINLDKLKSITLLNYHFDNSLNSFIEVQTYKAFNACIELEISSFIYWGSEF